MINRRYFFFSLFLTSLYGETLSLEPIRVTASSEEERASYSLDPSSTSTYALTLSDLLGSEGLGVKMMKWEAEEGFRFRGLSQDATLFLIDEIPMYKTVGGSVSTDLVSISTLKSVDINRGEGVNLHGLGPIGGVISLSSRLPEHPLETEGSISIDPLSHAEGIYIGTRQQNFYMTLNADVFDSRGFQLSDDFNPTSIEDSNKRLNSDQNRELLDFKIGKKLSDGGDVRLRLFSGTSDSGVAPYVYNDATTPFLHYLRVSDAMNSGAYLSYDSPWLGEWKFKGRMYSDKHTDTLKTYTDQTYTALMFDPSTYKDYRYGGLILGEYRWDDRIRFGMRGLYEQNIHNHYDGSNPLRSFESDTLNGSMTNSIAWTPYLQSTVAIGYEQLRPTKTYQWNDPSHPEKDILRDPLTAQTWQVALHYTIDQSIFADFSVGSKVKMPSMSQMFPFMPWENASPSLREETSLSWDGAWEKRLSYGSVRIASFWYDINDMISYDNVSGSYYNAQPSTIRGFEIIPAWNISSEHRLNLHYTYTDSKESDGSIIDYAPKHRAVASYDWTGMKGWSFTTLLNYSGESYYLHTQSNEQKLAAYLTADIRMMYQSNAVKWIFGVRNLSDENYQSSWGYPQSGRAFYTTLSLGYETF